MCPKTKSVIFWFILRKKFILTRVRKCTVFEIKDEKNIFFFHYVWEYFGYFVLIITFFGKVVEPRDIRIVGLYVHMCRARCSWNQFKFGSYYVLYINNKILFIIKILFLDASVCCISIHCTTLTSKILWIRKSYAINIRQVFGIKHRKCLPQIRFF